MCSTFPDFAFLKVRGQKESKGSTVASMATDERYELFCYGNTGLFVVLLPGSWLQKFGFVYFGCYYLFVVEFLICLGCSHGQLALILVRKRKVLLCCVDIEFWCLVCILGYLEDFASWVYLEDCNQLLVLLFLKG